MKYIEIDKVPYMEENGEEVPLNVDRLKDIIKQRENNTIEKLLVKVFNKVFDQEQKEKTKFDIEDLTIEKIKEVLNE